MSDMRDLNATSGDTEADQRRPTRRAWLLGVGAAATAGAAVWKGEELVQWAKVSFFQSTDAIRGQYRDPAYTEAILAQARDRFPYNESPLAMYCAEERRLVGDSPHLQAALAVADNIANRVAQRMFDEYRALLRRQGQNDDANTLTPEVAMRVFASSEHNLKLYAAYIAEELTRAGAFYFEESSLSRALDPSVHADPSAFHLDCDLLCHFALHCAYRHNMPLQAMRCPQHMYLGSTKYPTFCVEMTEFQKLTRQRSWGDTKVVAAGLGDDFYSSDAKQRSPWRFRDATVEDRFGFFRPYTEALLRESMVGNLLAHMLEQAGRIAPANRAQALEAVCATADRELTAFSGKMLVAQNAYAAHGEARDFYVERWRKSQGKDDEARRTGMQHAERALALKRTHGEYLTLVYGSRDDDRMLELFSGVNFEQLNEQLERLDALQRRINRALGK